MKVLIRVIRVIRVGIRGLLFLPRVKK